MLPRSGRLESRVGYELKRAQHDLRLSMDGALKELGATTPQYAALSVLPKSLGSRTPYSPGALSSRPKR